MDQWRNCKEIVKYILNKERDKFFFYLFGLANKEKKNKRKESLDKFDET